MAEPPGLLWQREAEHFGERADQYHPAKKSAHLAVGACAPRRDIDLEAKRQVARVVVRERPHVERVGDRLGSPGFRISQRNSTHMLGTLPLMREVQHLAAA